MPGNKKPRRTGGTRGSKKTAKRFDSTELQKQLQGRRVTLAIAADLREHAPAVLRKLTTNRDALGAINLAEATKSRYLVFGGHLMVEGAGCLAVLVADDSQAGEQLLAVVTAVNTEMAAMSDTTIWSPLLNEADRARIAPIAGGGAAA